MKLSLNSVAGVGWGEAAWKSGMAALGWERGVAVGGWGGKAVWPLWRVGLDRMGLGWVRLGWGGLGVVWCGVLWCGAVWCGAARCGVCAEKCNRSGQAAVAGKRFHCYEVG